MTSQQNNDSVLNPKDLCLSEQLLSSKSQVSTTRLSTLMIGSSGKISDSTKKRHRRKTTLSDKQLYVLKEALVQNPYPNSLEREKLAALIHSDQQKVETRIKNQGEDQRMKLKSCSKLLHLNDGSVYPQLAFTPIYKQSQPINLSLKKTQPRSSFSGKVYRSKTEKRNHKRTQFTSRQLEILKDNYKKNSYPDNAKLDELVNQTQLRLQTVKDWFQNLRRKEKNVLLGKTKKVTKKIKISYSDKRAAKHDSLDSYMSKNGYVDCTDMHPPSLVFQPLIQTEPCYCILLQKLISK